jgi:poly(3-hydroxybutyrate) depolymerase
MKMHSPRCSSLIAFLSIGLSLSGLCLAGPLGLFGERGLKETTSSPGVITENYNGRDLLAFVPSDHAPSNLPAQGARALVIVLHGGLGNASRIGGWPSFARHHNS